MTKTIRGKPCVVVDGYEMVIHKQNSKGGYYWRCSNYKTCYARGITESPSDTVLMTKWHNHMPDVDNQKVGQFVSPSRRK